MLAGRWKKGICLALVFTCLAQGNLEAAYASSTSEKIDDANETIQDLEKQKEEADQKVDDLEDQKGQLEDTLSGLNDDLSTLSSEIEDLENQVSNKKAEIQKVEEEIEATQASLEEAQAVADNQYESMKKRIQYMYESGVDQSMLTSLLESKSIGEFLNQVEYISQLASYDRKMLASYQETTAQIAEQKEELENQKASLEEEQSSLAALQSSQESKKSELSQKIANTQQSIANSEGDIAEAQSESDSLTAQIEEQKDYEKKLEAQLAAEEAARIAEIKAQEEANSANAAVVSNSESDLSLLEALIYCEAGGESYDGQLAVGCVVMNRVRSSAFPNTVSGVIYQSNQFSPVASGRLATVLANNLTTDSCRQAAASVLAGNLAYPDFLYFRSASVSLPGVEVTWIGNQQFF